MESRNVENHRKRWGFVAQKCVKKDIKKGKRKGGKGGLEVQ
jgi:hypothetical protein